MADEKYRDRFPITSKVFDKLEATKNPNLLKMIGFTLLAIGVVGIDLPGALIKTIRDLRENLKKPPSI